MKKNLDPNSTLGSLLSDLDHHGKPNYNEFSHPVQVRLNSTLYAQIEALTMHAGTSRNKVMNQLVQLGVDEVLSSLDESVFSVINDKIFSVHDRIRDGKSIPERESE